MKKNDYKNNQADNINKKNKSAFRKFVDEYLTVKNVLYYYTIGIISFCLVSKSIDILEHTEVLNIPVRSMFLIDIGNLLYDITIYLVPALFIGAMSKIIRKKSQGRKIGYIMTQGLKKKIFLSCLFALANCGAHIAVFEGITFSHIAYTFLFSFFIMLLTMSAFLGLFKELLPVLDMDLQRRPSNPNKNKNVKNYNANNMPSLNGINFQNGNFVEKVKRKNFSYQNDDSNN